MASTYTAAHSGEKNKKLSEKKTVFLLSLSALAAITLLFYPFMESVTTLILSLVIEAVIAALSIMLFGRGAASFIPAVLIIVLIAAFFARFSAGMIIFINTCTDVINTRFGTQITEFASAGGAADLRIFFCIISAALALLVTAIFLRRIRFYVGLAVFILADIFVLFRINISTPVLICVIVLASMLWICGINICTRNMRNLIFVMLIILGTAVTAALVLSPFGGAKTIASAQSAVTNAIHNTRYGTDTLPRGDLLKADKMCVGEKILMKVTLSEPHEEYLRGFVGAEYSGSAWGEHSAATMTGEWNGLFSWLKRSGFSEKTQTFAYRTLIGESTDTITLDIENKGGREFIYTPYALSSFDDDTGDEDYDLSIKSNGLFGRAAYKLSHAVYDDLELDLIRLSVVSPTRGSSQYDNAAKVYDAFVDDVYTDIDDDVKAKLDEIFFGSDYLNGENGGLYSAITRIRAVMELTAAETDTPPKYSGEKEFIDWFLNDVKEGNSAYFATAGAIALRAAGYPTRYAEGYYIPSNIAPGTTVLTPSDAHAWCEVYISGAGWIPVEFTPGYYTSDLLSEQTVELSKDAAGSGEDNSPYSLGEEFAGDSTPSDESKSSSPILLSALLLAGLVGIVLLAAIVLLLRAFIISKLRKKKFSAKGGERHMYGYIVKIMNLAGIKCDGTHPEDYTDAVTEKFPGVRREEYLRMISLMQKSVFGGAELKPYELRSVNLYARKTAALLYQSSNPAKRLALRFINVIT